MKKTNTHKGKITHYTKLFRQHNGEQLACIQIHADHYNCSLGHIMQMVAELKKDFPDIKDKDIQVQKYGGQRVKGITFVETFFDKQIPPPPGYEKVDEIEYVL